MPFRERLRRGHLATLTQFRSEQLVSMSSPPPPDALNPLQADRDVSVYVSDSPLAQSARNDSQANRRRDQPPSSDEPKNLRGVYAPHDPNNVELKASVER